MNRQVALSAANILYHIENTESALDELENSYFQNLQDEIYAEFEHALNDRLKQLNKELEDLKDVRN